MLDDLAAAKSELRRRAEAQRSLLHAVDANAGASVAAHFLAAIPLPAAAVIGAYIPIRNEADCLVLVRRLQEKGHKIALPRIQAKNRPLNFHEWPVGKATVEGSYRVPEPAPGWPEATPHIVLVPLLAFDAKGHRIGYGGGYYDRTLRTLRAAGPTLAVGIAFAGQEADALPVEANDQKLDWVVTELAARKFES